MARHERGRTEPGAAQTRFGAGQLDGIDVQPDQASARLQRLENGLCVPRTAECAVHRDLAGRRAKAAENLIEHDRAMRPIRRLEYHGVQPMDCCRIARSGKSIGLGVALELGFGAWGFDEAGPERGDAARPTMNGMTFTPTCLWWWCGSPRRRAHRPPPQLMPRDRRRRCVTARANPLRTASASAAGASPHRRLRAAPAPGASMRVDRGPRFLDSTTIG